MRKSATDTAALCVNCDAQFANGVRVTAAAPDSTADGRQPHTPDTEPAARVQAAGANEVSRPRVMSPPGLTSAGVNGHRGSVQQGAAAHGPVELPGTNAPPPAPRATLPVALRPHEASNGGAVNHGSGALGPSLGRRATGQQREDAAALGSVGVGHAGSAQAAGHDGRSEPVGPAAQAMHSPSAAVFGAAERPVPRMFSRPAAASSDAEPSGSDAAASSGREQAEDAATDGDYSPTSDPRLGPFARPPADRAPSTPDR